MTIQEILKNIKPKFYVFCNDTHDGGRLEKFETLEEAQKYLKMDSDAEAIIQGINITDIQDEIIKAINNNIDDDEISFAGLADW